MSGYMKGLKPLPADFASKVMDLELGVESGKFTYDSVYQ
jgi:hypothetical protein